MCNHVMLMSRDFEEEADILKTQALKCVFKKFTQYLEQFEFDTIWLNGLCLF